MNGIRARVLFLLLAILIPVLLVQAAIYRQRFETRRLAEQATNLEVARGAAETFDQFVKNVLAQEQAIGLAITLPDVITAEGIHQILLQAKGEYAAVSDFGWISPQGKVVYAGDLPSEGLDVSFRPYFRKIKAGREASVSDLFIFRTTGKPVFVIARGIRDSQGDLLGVVAAVIDPEKLAGLFPKERMGNRAIILADSQGRAVFRIPQVNWTWEGRFLPDRFPQLQNALQGREISGTEVRAPGGRKRIYALTPVSRIGWVAGASIPEADTLAVIQKQLRQHAVLFLLVLLLAFLTASWFALRSILYPLKGLQQFAMELRAKKLPHRMEPAGPVEFQDLGRTLNAMAEEVTRWTAKAESEYRRLRAVLDALPVGVFIAGPDGRIVEINDQVKAVWGGEPPICENASEYGVYKGCWAGTGKSIRAEEWALARALNRGETSIGEVIDIERFDGRPATILNSAAPIRNREGLITGAVVVIQDITRQRNLERKATEQAATLKTILDTVPVGVVMARAGTGEILFTSPETDRILGGPVTGTAEASGPDAYVLLRPDGAPFPRDQLPLLRSMKQGKRITDEEMRVRRADGSERMVAVNAAPTRDQAGRILGAVASLVDITERKQAEAALKKAHGELERRVEERTAELAHANSTLVAHVARLERLNQELEEFSWIASHDLQEPLRKIQAFGSRLEEKGDALDPDAREDVRRMIRSAGRMASLVRALKTYAEVTRGPGSLAPANLTEVVQEALSDLEPAIEEAGGRVEVAALPTLEADRNKLRQLFGHLIHNAITYARRDQPPVVAITGRVHGGICRIQVADNGIGFEEKYGAKIFAPFQRLHGKESPYEGTGMGLAICRKVVELHGGTITARSEPGKGATFVIRLPLKPDTSAS